MEFRQSLDACKILVENQVDGNPSNAVERKVIIELHRELKNLAALSLGFNLDEPVVARATGLFVPDFKAYNKVQAFDHGSFF